LTNSGGIQRVVDGHDLARQGRVEVADGLGGLDLATAVTGSDRVADARGGDVDDIPSASWAKAVMPTRTVSSPVLFTHSCSGV
jgi:hypothetical protein